MKTRTLFLLCILLLSGRDMAAQPIAPEMDAQHLDLPPGVTGETITVPLPGHKRMAFVYIAPDSFLMGSPKTELGRASNEGPQHEVEISHAFYMGKYEVTWGQWQAVMTDTLHKDLRNPVEGVSWNDAIDFIHRLNIAAGDSLYRLPTEAEWEYACRAGTTTPWSFGNDERYLAAYAWYRPSQSYASLLQKRGPPLIPGDVSPEALYDDMSGGAVHPVGLKRPNAWGLYDMQGNVWEWCQDWYASTYYSISPAVDPLGPPTGDVRVIRGGFYNGFGRSLRCANRYNLFPNDRIPGTGLRLVRRIR